MGYVSQRNRTASVTSVVSAVSDDEFEDSKSGLSSESGTDNDALQLSPSQTVRVNMSLDNQDDNLGSRPECDFISNPGFHQGHHTNTHINDNVASVSNLISEIVESPPNSNCTQQPIPMARRKYTDSSQVSSLS